MFSKEVLGLLKQVILSWQVIFITVALVLYIFIVNYTARSYHPPRNFKKISFKLKPKKAKPAAESTAGDENEISDTNDDLGLEEA